MNKERIRAEQIPTPPGWIDTSRVSPEEEQELRRQELIEIYGVIPEDSIPDQASSTTPSTST
jgi:hypothetical protein